MNRYGWNTIYGLPKWLAHTGLGQTTQGPPLPGTPVSTAIEIKPVYQGTLYKYGDGSFEVYGNDGSYYLENPNGAWLSQEGTNSPLGSDFRCWGDATGSWICDDGSTGGNWTNSKGAPIRKKAQQAKAAATATPTPTPVPTQSPSGATSPPLTITPGSPPPEVHDQNEKPLREYIDDYGSLVQIFASGASYYQFTNGTWTYDDGQGYSITGDAQGNACDSDGYCRGNPNWASTAGGGGGGGGGGLFGNVAWGGALTIGAIVVVALIVLTGGGGGGRRK